MKHPPRDARALDSRASRTVALLAGGALLASAVAAPAAASPGQEVSSLRDVTEADLGSTLAGEGVTVTGATFTGVDVQAGTFSDLAFGAIAPSTGVVLSSGSVIPADPQADGDTDFTESSVLGPNTKLTTSGDFGGPGSPLLEELFGETTYDAAVLTLEVVPEGSELSLEYVFGSEEYAVWAEQDFRDAFAIVVDGEVCSVVPGSDDPVGTATINTDVNENLYVANFEGIDPGAIGYDTEMNGFTSTLECVAEVTPGEPATVVVAVADTVDGQLDSSVLLAADSLTSTPEPDPTPTPTPTPSPTATPSPTPSPTADPTKPGLVGGGGGGGGTLPWSGAGPLPLALLTGALLAGGTGSWLLARRLRGTTGIEGAD